MLNHIHHQMGIPKTDSLSSECALAVEPWLSTAKAYVAAPAKYPDPNGEIKAVDGVKAPEGTILEIKGAFIDQYGQERVAANKTDRAQQIHLYGFT